MKSTVITIDLKSPGTCEAGLDAIDQNLARNGGWISIANADKWSPKRKLERLLGFIWAGQVTQNENHECDSPRIQVIERRATTDLSVQDIDYERIINQIDRVVETAETAIGTFRRVAEEEQAKASQQIEVDIGNTDNLDASAREAVKKHDEGVRRAALLAAADVARAKLAAWEAVLSHAKRTRQTALSDRDDFRTMVRSHYAQQAQDHIKWAVKRNGLSSPYLLPGALSGGTPELLAREGE